MTSDKKNYSSNWKLLQETLRASIKQPTFDGRRAANSSGKKLTKRRHNFKQNPANSSKLHGKTNVSDPKLWKCVGIDCEYVGVGGSGSEDMLARVSVVNSNGDIIYDNYVKPTETVKDYRTFVSGIRPSQLKNGADYTCVQAKVAELLNGRILVGHAVHNDLRVLGLSHPKRMIRDTARYAHFRHLCKSRGTPSLKKVALAVLGVEIQQSEHDSATDSKIAMQVYQLHRKEWESSIKKKKKLR